MRNELRPYQKEAVENCIEFHKQRRNSQLLILPTGTGKTRTFCAIIDRLNYKTLIISHTSQLRKQIETECKKHCPNQFALSKTIQSLHRSETLKEIRALKFDMLIVDEAHHAASESYQNVLNEFKQRQKLVLGCTATPFRLDQQCIYKFFPHVICQKTIIQMVENGFLADIKGYRVKTKLNLDGVKCIKGDYNIRQLSCVVNSKNRNDIILSTYKKILSGKKTLIFCVDIAHCEEVAKIFTENDITAQSVHGKLSKEEQFLHLESFKNNNTYVLTTCQLLTEGFDEPSIEALMIARPTKSAGLYIQMVGRGLRIFPNKKYCEIVELTDNAHDICSFETLFTEKVVRNAFGKIENINSLKFLKNEIQIDPEILEIEDMKFFNKYHKKPMDYFQELTLRIYNIPFIRPLSYEMANILIENYQKSDKRSDKNP